MMLQARAIDQYHATVGGYPDSLPQLVLRNVY
jgi:hypothetical protein